MPLDTHVRVAAWLHVALAVLGLLVLMGVGLALGAFGAFGVHFGGDKGAVLGWLAGFGALLVGLFALLPAGELLGAVLLLRGSEAGRVLTILFSVLHLLNVPVGTAVGIYSLWAMLRKLPDAGPLDASQAVLEPAPRLPA